jgi:hypothetical protein
MVDVSCLCLSIGAFHLTNKLPTTDSAVSMISVNTASEYKLELTLFSADRNSAGVMIDAMSYLSCGVTWQDRGLTCQATLVR